MSYFQPTRGVVILYAVLITTVLAVVGVSLSNIIARQILLSTLDRGSHLAYYAAHGGYQCAKNLNLFNQDGPTAGGALFDFASGDTISCGGKSVALGQADDDQRYFCFNYNDQYCTKVIVERAAVSVGGGTQYDFTYTAFGYNVRCADMTNRKVEQLILEGALVPANPNSVVCP
jgi:hypothetical protein